MIHQKKVKPDKVITTIKVLQKGYKFYLEDGLVQDLKSTILFEATPGPTIVTGLNYNKLNEVLSKYKTLYDEKIAFFNKKIIELKFLQTLKNALEKVIALKKTDFEFLLSRSKKQNKNEKIDKFYLLSFKLVENINLISSAFSVIILPIDRHTYLLVIELIKLLVDNLRNFSFFIDSLNSFPNKISQLTIDETVPLLDDLVKSSSLVYEVIKSISDQLYEKFQRTQSVDRFATELNNLLQAREKIIKAFGRGKSLEQIIFEVRKKITSLRKQIDKMYRELKNYKKTKELVKNKLISKQNKISKLLQVLKNIQEYKYKQGTYYSILSQFISKLSQLNTYKKHQFFDDYKRKVNQLLQNVSRYHDEAFKLWDNYSDLEKKLKSTTEYMMTYENAIKEKIKRLKHFTGPLSEQQQNQLKLYEKALKYFTEHELSGPLNIQQNPGESAQDFTRRCADKLIKLYKEWLEKLETERMVQSLLSMQPNGFSRQGNSLYGFHLNLNNDIYSRMTQIPLSANNLNINLGLSSNSNRTINQIYYNMIFNTGSNRNIDGNLLLPQYNFLSNPDLTVSPNSPDQPQIRRRP